MATIGRWVAAGWIVACATPALADDAAVTRGEYIARAGDCQSCHTSPGKPAFSGGDAIDTPFGPIYPPNITPDKVHGIGAWSDDEFYRALHEGVGKGGEYLYPAFPYLWYTKITRDDAMAIRAYLASVPPSDRPSQPPRLAFPFNIRTGLGAWNAAFFKPGEYKPDPSKSAEWNRGAYLVEGLGHCGDCHTPKGAAMQPVSSKAFSGGAIADWYAPDITSNAAQGIGKWSVDDLAKYLKTGATPDKGAASGLMAQVVHDSLAYLTDDDIHAIATFLKATPPIAAYKTTDSAGETKPRGAAATAYVTYCASCHQLDGRGLPGAVPALAGDGTVNAKGPEDVVRLILAGHLASGTFAAMPAVGAGMTDEQIAEATDYVRSAWGNSAPAISERGLVGRIREHTATTLLGPGKTEVNGDPCYPGEGQPVKPIADPQIDSMLGALKPQAMLPAMTPLVERARQVDPKLSQADIVNGLALDYCRLAAKTGALDKPDGRERIAQFLSNAYTALTSNGHE